MSVGTRLGIDETGEMADTEITLGTGKLLGIFFTAAVVCALFFGLGFNLGRASAPQPDPNVVTALPANGSNAAKPSAATHPASTTPCPTGQICSDSGTSDTPPPATPPEGTEAAAPASPTAN